MQATNRRAGVLRTQGRRQWWEEEAADKQHRDDDGCETGSPVRSNAGGILDIACRCRRAERRTRNGC